MAGLGGLSAASMGPGWTRPRTIGRRWGVRLPTHIIDRRPSMEVLRWLLFFAIAMFLIVAGIFFLMGRPLPLPF